MQQVIRIVGTPIVEFPIPEEVGHYLKAYTANGGDGRGVIETTDNIDEAMRFPDLYAAIQCYRSVSTTHPLRPDFLPNRPLTAFTLEFVKVRE